MLLVEMSPVATVILCRTDRRALAHRRDSQDELSWFVAVEARGQTHAMPANEQTAAPMTTRDFMRGLAKQHPPFLKAVIADARCASARLGRPLEHASRYQVATETVRLAFQSDAFIALALYRCKA